MIKAETNEIVIAPLCDEFDSCYSDANNRIRNNETIWKEFCSHCTEQCSNVDFVVTASSIAAPLGDYFLQEAKKFVEKSGVEISKNWSQIWLSELEKNYISLDILPETTRVEIYSQTASIGPVDLLSNVGGQTGLWIGLSFLSLVEIIEMIFRLLRFHVTIVQNKVLPRSQCVNTNEPNSF